MKKTISSLVVAALITLPLHAQQMGRSDQLLRSTLWDSNGKPVAMEGLKGKRVVVSFYASWCAGCRQEVTDLNALKEQEKGKLDVVGISLDNDTRLARDFASKTAMRYFNIVSGDIGKGLMKSLGNPGVAIPFTVVIERNGEVSLQKVGNLSKADLESLSSRS